MYPYFAGYRLIIFKVNPQLENRNKTSW
jgi:hypothetical protein